MSVTFQYSIHADGPNALTEAGSQIYYEYCRTERILGNEQTHTDNGDNTSTITGTLTFVDEQAKEDYLAAIGPHLNLTQDQSA